MAKAKTTDGKVIRISQEVYRELVARRRTKTPKTRMWEPWDSTLRRLLALPDRDGLTYACIEGFVVPGSAKFFETLSRARGEAIVIQARKELDRPPKPVPVREVV